MNRRNHEENKTRKIGFYKEVDTFLLVFVIGGMACRLWTDTGDNGGETEGSGVYCSGNDRAATDTDRGN